MDNPSFEEGSNFVRDFTVLSKNKKITAETKLADDLGITGDDSTDFLEEAEKYFSISWPTNAAKFRELFGLKENEYLFHSEGLDLIGIGVLIRWIKNEPKPIIKDLTVGEFHRVLNKLKQTQDVV